MISWYDLFLLLTKRQFRFRIEGNSMLPSFKNGDEVLIKPCKEYQVEDVVLANHPYKQSLKILKRINKKNDAGKFFLIGDNLDESSDSRSFGFISQNLIIGKVVSK